ncbi:MAG: hypothetical protein CM1200mP1_09880 [Candidatus Neomarinimicrobiota bacterium]|nr:MAG: hypothetical protein CM1200mP1_09880 [Candidatus Neomarinimicrobiota bacterium]
MNWVTSPAATELESHVLDWLVDMMELPKNLNLNQGRRCFQDTASSSSLVALIAAREKASKGEINNNG